MSDEKTQEAVDLDIGGSDAPDAPADGASTTNEQETDSTGEESKETLDLDLSVDSPDKASEQRALQAKAWAKKVMAGDATMDELPAQVQWLKKDIEGILGATKKSPAIEDIVEQKLAEREDKRKFDTLQGTLKDARLSKAQISDIKAEFKEFRTLGMLPAKALEKAMKITGIDLDAQKTARLKNSMRLPQTGRSTVSSKDTPADAGFWDKTPKDRIAALEKLRTGRVSKRV